MQAMDYAKGFLHLVVVYVIFCVNKLKPLYSI